MPALEQFGPVLAVFLLLGATLWFLKGRGMVRFQEMVRPRAADKRIEVVERCSLTPQHSVHLVRVAGRMLLIGVAPNNCQLLSDEINERPS